MNFMLRLVPNLCATFSSIQPRAEDCRQSQQLRALHFSLGISFLHSPPQLAIHAQLDTVLEHIMSNEATNLRSRVRPGMCTVSCKLCLIVHTGVTE